MFDTCPDTHDRPTRKVTCHLVPVTEEWPPCRSESVWATPVDDLYEILSVPLFTPNLGRGDLIAAVQAQGEMLEYLKLVESAGHETLVGAADEAADLVYAMGALTALGAYVEPAPEQRLLGIDIAPEVEAGPLHAWLDRAEAEGLLSSWRNDAPESDLPADGEGVASPRCACCGELIDPEELVLLKIHGQPTGLPRIPYGAEAGHRRQSRTCPTCQAPKGALHRPNCRSEQCPYCSTALSQCPCPILAWGRSL
jgi:hypothetical protein